MIISHLISLLIGQAVFIYITKVTLKVRISNNRLFLSLLIASLLFFISYGREPLFSCVMFLTIPLSLMINYKLSLRGSIYASLFLFFIIVMIETIMFMVPFFATNLKIIRANPWIFLFINLLVYLIALSILNNIYLKRIYKRMLSEKEVSIHTITFIITLIIAISLIYNLFMLKTVNSYDVTVISLLLLLFLFMLFIFRMIKYYELKATNSGLYEYVTQFEEIIDNYELNNHEHYNQLAAIRAMTTNKKVKEYIDSIIKTETKEIKSISRIPNGGVKGIITYKYLYYKIKDIKFNIIIDKESKTYLSKMKVLKERYITNLLGVYLDNACEEVENSSKEINLEIYFLDNNLNIVISNLVKDLTKLIKTGSKNYSTKSKLRGKGLYLSKKLIDQKYGINLNTKIINNYYVQHIKITKD